MSKKEEKKEEIIKPISLEIKETKEEFVNVLKRHNLFAVSIEEIGLWLVEEARNIQKQEEQQYFEKLQESMKGEEKENAN